MSQPLLYHEPLTHGRTDPSQWALVLHGVFGSGRNWAGVVQRLIDQRNDWGALLIDLREHGQSTGMDGPHTLQNAAEDLNPVARQAPGEPTAAIGHSFGGKVALQWAANPDKPATLKQIWIVDATPDAEPGQPTGDAWNMLQLLRELPGPFESRAEAVADLQSHNIAMPVASWMAMNLDRTDGVMQWRFDLDHLESLLRDFYRTDLWNVVENPPENIEFHFIKASDSDIITPAAVKRIEAAASHGSVHLHYVEGNHWLNVSNPDALVEILTNHLPKP